MHRRAGTEADDQERSDVAHHCQGFSQAFPLARRSLTSRFRAGKRRPSALLRELHRGTVQEVPLRTRAIWRCDCDQMCLRALLTTCRQARMAISLDKFNDRWGRTLVILSLVYSAACAVVVFTGWGGQKAAEFIGAWGTFPLMIVAALVLWPVVVDPMQTRRCRLAFRLILGALALDFVATAGWSY